MSSPTSLSPASVEILKPPEDMRPEIWAALQKFFALKYKILDVGKEADVPQMSTETSREVTLTIPRGYLHEPMISLHSEQEVLLHLATLKGDRRIAFHRALEQALKPWIYSDSPSNF